ncbi:MAG: methyltransferase domain-containing protein [Pseudomonadota bacterium]
MEKCEYLSRKIRMIESMAKNTRTALSSESLPMRILNRLGMERLAWSLRRLHCPVSSDALVLEVGSGGNPYPRANVLLDAYEDTVERNESKLVKDRPLAIGYVERMPFKSQSFDFIIASHVLEHSPDPVNFLGELMRVGKSGYIETPDGFFERLNPFTYHRLEVTDIDGKLRIFNKPSWRHDSEVVTGYERKMKDAAFLGFLSKHPGPFYTRFYWRNSIPYWIVNPGVDVSWPLPERSYSKIGSPQEQVGFKMRRVLGSLIRNVLSQNSRNRSIDLVSLLRCPSCLSEADLLHHDDGLQCEQCAVVYPVNSGVPVMYPR